MKIKALKSLSAILGIIIAAAALLSGFSITAFAAETLKGTPGWCDSEISEVGNGGFCHVELYEGGGSVTAPGGGKRNGIIVYNTEKYLAIPYTISKTAPAESGTETPQS